MTFGFGNQDGGVRGCGAHLPPKDTPKLQLHVEKLSWKTNWKLSEGLL